MNMTSASPEKVGLFLKNASAKRLSRVFYRLEIDYFLYCFVEEKR